MGSQIAAARCALSAQGREGRKRTAIFTTSLLRRAVYGLLFDSTYFSKFKTQAF